MSSIPDQHGAVEARRVRLRRSYEVEVVGPGVRMRGVAAESLLDFLEHGDVLIRSLLDLGRQVRSVSQDCPAEEVQNLLVLKSQKTGSSFCHRSH